MNLPIDEENLRLLAHKARWAEYRLRFSDSLGALVSALPFVGVYALGALTWIKVARPTAQREQQLFAIFCIALLSALGFAIVRFLKRRPARFGAQALDRHHQYRDRITNALTFGALPTDQRTGLMQAAIDDGTALAKDVRVAPASPIRLPKDLLITALLAGAVWGVSLVEVQEKRVVAVSVRHVEPVALNAEDLELLAEVAEELTRKTTDPEVSEAVKRFNQLVEDIADRRVERREVFRRLDALESALLKGLQTEEEALDEGLRGIARELDKSRMTKPVAEALQNKRLDDAEQALRELAKTLRNKKKVDKQELDRLRRALEQASKASSGRLERLAAQRQELEEQQKRLLQKKKKDGKLSKNDEQALNRNRSQLQRLQRNKERADRAKKKMSQLDKDLAKAASEVMKQLGEAAQGLDKGAEDINRAARQELTNEEKRALKRRLEELREMLRQEGKGGKDRAQRLLRFGRRARGGKPGKGGSGQGEGQGKQPGKGKGPTQIRIGPGASGVQIDMPTAGGSPAPGDGSGQQGDGQQGGKEWGSGSDPNVRGDETALKGGVQDVSAAGVDSGQGVSVSEVIYGAAERGFVGRGYKKVFVDYETVAEEVLNRDEIPPGYEFYVRRYFQLIRPRE